MHPLSPPKDWPHRDASQQIACRPHLWHVQVMGQGPDLLLIHGAGGATHSFRHLMPLLAVHYRCIAVDLPGQGFTRLGARGRCGLDPTAEDLASLCAQQGWAPFAVVGHSAGAALALRLAEIMPVRAVAGINAAIGSFDGAAGWLFPMMAKLLALTPFVSQVFSRLSGTEARVRSLLASTGSQIEPAGVAQYLTLLRSSGHVDATLAMMSQWKLDGLLTRLPGFDTPCLLITAAQDHAVPPSVSHRAAALMPAATLIDLPDHGHLVHEEAAAEVATVILDYLARLPAR